MKLRLGVAFLLSSIAFELRGQETNKAKLDLMQGIWENTMNSDSEKAFTIIRGNHSLNFVFLTTSDEFDFPINESVLGFQDDDSVRGDSIDSNNLKKDGKYYTIVDKKFIASNGWVHRPDYLTPAYFECNGDNMSINGAQLIEYYKIQRLPKIALRALYHKGKRDRLDYIKDYLDVDVMEIKSDLRIASEPRGTTNVTLPKGEMVYLKEVKGVWQRIEYQEGDDLREGWVERKYLK
jgi:hypothetical protein